MRAALRDAGLAAFVALVLAIPLVGFRAVDTGGPLGLDTRFDAVAIGVAVVFLGRLAIAIRRDRQSSSRSCALMPSAIARRAACTMSQRPP